MAYVHKNLEGALFYQDKKSSRSPDLSGVLMINGVAHDLAAWQQTSKNGKKYYAVRARPRQQPSTNVTPLLRDDMA